MTKCVAMIANVMRIARYIFFFCVEFGCKFNCLSVFLDKNSDYLNIFYLFMYPFPIRDELCLLSNINKMLMFVNWGG
jgi:hypothetical protein